MIRGLTAAIVFGMSVFPGHSLAQTEASQVGDEVNREAVSVFNEIMSPFCPGFTLTNCTSSQAADLRDEIRVWIAEGRDREEIFQVLVSRYGEEVYASPPARGFGLAAWIAPIIALVVGLVWAAKWLTGRGTSAAPPALEDIPPEDQARIDAEMAKLT